MRTTVSMECERTPEHSCMRFDCKRNGRCLVVYCIILLSASKIYLADPGGRTKAWFCGRSLARIAGSNPTRGMDVCLFLVMCVVTVSLQRADHSYKRVLPSMVCLSVIEEPRRGGLGPLRLSSREYSWIYSSYSVKLSRYALSRRLGGPQGRSARVGERKKLLSSPGVEPRTVRYKY
jgi:hypothetical protein